MGWGLGLEVAYFVTLISCSCLCIRSLSVSRLPTKSSLPVVRTSVLPYLGVCESYRLFCGTLYARRKVCYIYINEVVAG